MTPQKRRHFERLLNPRHIAFIGGADAIIAIGEARRRGFEGNYWPVNPRRDQMGGLACFDSVDDLPEAPDAVFLAIPAVAAVAFNASKFCDKKLFKFLATSQALELPDVNKYTTST